MANASEMDNDFSYFIKKVLTLYVAIPELRLPKDEVLPQMPDLRSDVVTDELIETCLKALWFKTRVAHDTWLPFLAVYANDILESPHSYVSSVMYMCKLTFRESVSEIFERLLCVIAAVNAAAVFCFNEYGHSFSYTAPMMVTYFDKVLKTGFYHNGGWNGLSVYMDGKYYLELFSLRYSAGITKRLESYLETYVHAPNYLDSIEYIVPDHIKQDHQCADLFEEMIKSFFPEQVETLERLKLNLSNIERAMKNLNISQPGASTSNISVVQPSKESGHATAEDYTSSVLSKRISKQFLALAKYVDEHMWRDAEGSVASTPSLHTDHHSTCHHRQLYPIVEIPAAAESASVMYDLARLIEIEKSAFLKARSILHDLKCDATRLHFVLESLSI